MFTRSVVMLLNVENLWSVASLELEKNNGRVKEYDQKVSRYQKNIKAHLSLDHYFKFSFSPRTILQWQSQFSDNQQYHWFLAFLNEENDENILQRRRSQD